MKTIYKILLLLILVFGVSAYANDLFAKPSADSLGATVLSATTVVGLSTLVKDKCTIPKEELKALEAKYGKIKILSVILEEPTRDETGNILDIGEVYYFVIRRPDPGHMRMLMKYATDGDTDKYIDAAIKNLVVGGDLTKLESDGLVYMGVANQLEGILKPYQSFLTGA